MGANNIANVVLGGYEYLIWLIYVAVGAVFLYVYKLYHAKESHRYIMPAYFLKMTGGLIFTWIYYYYYNGEGDNFTYYSITKKLVDIFYQNPGFFLELQFKEMYDAQELIIAKGYSIDELADTETWFFVRIISIFNILSFNSYLGLSFYMSLISFIGSFQLYRIFSEFIKGKSFAIFLICFMAPSVLIWGSAINKDTLTCSSLYILLIFFYQILYKRKLYYVLFTIFPLYIIFALKAYIIISFMIWLLMTLFFFFINKSNNPVTKFLLYPYLALIIGFGGYSASVTMMNNSVEYKVDDIEARIEGFRTWHKELGGSYYDLGDIDYSLLGFISKIPPGINVTLFRPYLWESRTIFMLMNGLESLVLLAFTIYSLIKTGFLGLIRIIRENAFLFGALFFCLFYAYIVGITSYNFGALSRFRIPIVPIYLFLMFYAVQKVNENKNEEVLK